MPPAVELPSVQSAEMELRYLTSVINISSNDGDSDGPKFLALSDLKWWNWLIDLEKTVRTIL